MRALLQLAGACSQAEFSGWSVQCSETLLRILLKQVAEKMDRVRDVAGVCVIIKCIDGN